MTIHKLVTPPTAQENVQKTIVDTLKSALAEAEAGQLTDICLVIGYVNGEWACASSDTLEFTRLIGRLTILQHEWITEYNQGDE